VQPEQRWWLERGVPSHVVAIHHYDVYGLHVQSAIAIAGLEATPPASPDCILSLGDVEPLPDPVDDDVTRDGDRYVFAYADGTRFRIEERGRRIITSWQSTAEDMASYLLGPVLAFVLRLRGTLALHASAVRVDGRALLFAGAAGAGKSTTAAAFVARGATMLADDVAAIDWRDGTPHVRAGYPRLRLWDDSAAALYGLPEALPLLTPTWTKRFADTRNAFSLDTTPIRALLLLGDRDTTTHTRRLAGAEAVMAVLTRTSVPHLVDAALRDAELSELTRLVDAIPILELHVREDLTALDDLPATIEDALS
jgi:hypothetical protein